MPKPITLGGVPYEMRPSFEALSAIEQSLGLGLVALSRKLTGGMLSLQELSVIVSEMIRASGDTVPQDMEYLLVGGGLAASLASVAIMLADVFEGEASLTTPMTRDELAMLQEKFPDAL